MNFGEKLKNARKEKGLSQQKLADLIGVNRVAITNYETNKNTATYENIMKLSEVLGVELASEEKNIGTIKCIPLIGKASCGIPINYDLNGYDKVPISTKDYKDGMYAVEAEGDSMLPKISDGDIVYCKAENSEHIDSGAIVHYQINDESGIKKYKLSDDGKNIFLIPLNAEFDTIIINCDDPVTLKLSKVTGIYRRF
jgi:repressor LexA